MAEREPGFYWVKFDDEGIDEWEVAQWTRAGTWLVIGMSEEYSGDDCFDEIGERVERQSQDFSAADLKVIGYLKKRFRAHTIIEARSRSDNGTVVEMTRFITSSRRRT